MGVRVPYITGGIAERSVPVQVQIAESRWNLFQKIRIKLRLNRLYLRDVGFYPQKGGGTPVIIEGVQGGVFFGIEGIVQPRRNLNILFAFFQHKHIVTGDDQGAPPADNVFYPAEILRQQGMQFRNDQNINIVFIERFVGI